MNREEFIAKLQMVYVGDRNAFNEIVGVYDNLKEENERLNNVLNELKKDLQEAFNELQPNELIDGRNLIENILNELKESDNNE